MDYRTLIDAAALATLLQEADPPALFDCSFDLTAPDAGRALYEAGCLPSARYLDLDRDLSAVPDGANGRHPLPDPRILARKLRAEGLRDGQQVVAYDRSGGAYAARLWWLLRWLGHDRVALLDGGLPAWIAEGRPVRRADADPPAPGDFEPSAVLAERTVDAGTVRAAIGRPDRRILDARSAERFAGAVAAFDAVPGHIPSAANRPFVDNLAPDGRFKSAAALREELTRVSGGVAPDGLILQCGSGVTACHNALALEIAGMTGARLYPGSWSEWIADPSRPIATGAA